MKKIIITLVNLLIITSIYAQSPEKMSYQAVIRDGSNNLITSTAVGMQISILQGSTIGMAVYVETHSPSSNANGLVSLEIGAGTVVSGDFTTIDWANGPYFIKTETDPTGGTSYSITGTSQLLSVPYALYSKIADTVVNDQVNDADSDPTNELQTLSILADTITISNGNSIVLPSSSGSDNDWQVNGNDMVAIPSGNVGIGNGVVPNQKFVVGDTALFRVVIGHAGNFNEEESGRLVFSEDVNFNGTCGFEFHHDGDSNTLSIESGCTTLSDTSIVFTRTGEVRIPERVKIGENSNPSTDVHIKQSTSETMPSGAGIRFEAATTTEQYQIWNGGGSFNFGYNGTRVSYIDNTGAYTQASDRRLKSDIAPMGNVLDRIRLLEPVQYTYSHLNDSTISKGFIAQDVQKIFPEMVNIAEDTKMLALPYDEFSVIAIKAIQEQQKIIDLQQKQIDELKTNVEQLMQVIKIDSTPQKRSTDPHVESVNPNDADQK